MALGVTLILTQIKKVCQGGIKMNEKLVLTEEWDKTFPKSDKVNHRKVVFHNRYGITLAADLYDNLDVIPFDKIDSFFKEYLK